MGVRRLYARDERIMVTWEQISTKQGCRGKCKIAYIYLIVNICIAYIHFFYIFIFFIKVY